MILSEEQRRACEDCTSRPPHPSDVLIMRLTAAHGRRVHVLTAIIFVLFVWGAWGWLLAIARWI